MIEAKWHTGRTVGRTIYSGDGPDDLIGVMDTREIAAHIVRLHNRFIDEQADHQSREVMQNAREWPSTSKDLRMIHRDCEWIRSGEDILCVDHPGTFIHHSPRAAALIVQMHNIRRGTEPKAVS
jgi:hypothetical protein